MPAQQETTLTAVLADRLLEVPDYQRPYAWERKQLEDLWEDLDLDGPEGAALLRNAGSSGDHRR